ncbi:MAG: hypothetical protein AB7D36_11145 [Oscillospiraceae bacterium]
MKTKFDKRMDSYDREKARYFAWATSLPRIDIPDSRKWDYAIPENYTNYQNGFLWQDNIPQKGDPLMIYCGEMLYFWHEANWIDLNPGEKEKYIAFKRNGEKVLIAIIAEPEAITDGNPSYFDFITRVKKYVTMKKGPGAFKKVIYEYPRQEELICGANQ